MLTKASMVTIKEASPEEISYIDSLTIERIKERSSDDSAQVNTYVVELEGTFIGYMTISQTNPAEIEIEEFALLPEYRGQGYGRLAVKVLFNMLCAADENAGFYMRCLASEEPMIRLSTTEGFTIVGSDDKFFHLCKPCNDASTACIDDHKNKLSDNGGTLYRDNQDALIALVKELQNA